MIIYFLLTFLSNFGTIIVSSSGIKHCIICLTLQISTQCKYCVVSNTFLGFCIFKAEIKNIKQNNLSLLDFQVYHVHYHVMCSMLRLHMVYLRMSVTYVSLMFYFRFIFQHYQIIILLTLLITMMILINTQLSCTCQ